MDSIAAGERERKCGVNQRSYRYRTPRFLLTCAPTERFSDAFPFYAIPRRVQVYARKTDAFLTMTGERLPWGKPAPTAHKAQRGEQTQTCRAVLPARTFTPYNSSSCSVIPSSVAITD